MQVIDAHSNERSMRWAQTPLQLPSELQFASSNRGEKAASRDENADAQRHQENPEHRQGGDMHDTRANEFASS